MNEKSITDAARWIVDQHSQKKNYANLPESFGIGGLDDAYLVQQEVVGFFQNQRGRIGGHKLALTSKPIQQLCGLDHPCAGQLFHSEIHYGKHDLQLDDFLSVGIEFELAVRIAQDMTSIQGPWNRENILPFIDQGYPAFGYLLGGLAIATAVLTRPMWRRPVVRGEGFRLADLADAGALRLLLLALVNSLPVAVTSTLFLFFVEDRLQLAGMAGPLLVLFFLSAGLSVPLWTAASHRIGPRATLLVAMPLAILGFSGAALLAPGNLAGFAVVCLLSGAASGADLVILPAMFSIVLTRSRIHASMAFGIWSFATKLGLALAAATLLPLLDRFGFAPGTANSARSLGALNLAYAVLPCALKLVALALVFTLPAKEHRLA